MEELSFELTEFCPWDAPESERRAFVERWFESAQIPLTERAEMMEAMVTFWRENGAPLDH
jgi:hypothetical protein